MRPWTYGLFTLGLAVAGCSAEPGSNAASGASGHGNARRIAAPTLLGEADESGTPPALMPGACEPNQPVLTPELSNARDLGGTALANGQRVACASVYRGPPLRLSDAGCAEAANLSVRTVLDLRMEGERRSVPDASCVNAELVFAPLPIPYGLAAADYLNVLHATESIAVAFHAFGDPSAYPIYFHCTYGRDRTGVVGALLLLALGADRATVMQEYLLSQPNVGAYPESLNAVLDEVEQRGGAEAVLREAGITDAELRVLRERAIAGP